MMHLNYREMKMRYHRNTHIQNKEHHVVKSHFSVSLDNLASVSEHSGVISTTQLPLMTTDGNEVMLYWKHKEMLAYLG